MAEGLKFSDQELADLREVAYGGYRKIKPRKVAGRGGFQGRTEPGGVDYNYYRGLTPKNKNLYIRGFDPMVESEKGSTSANFGKIAKHLGIKNVDSRNDLRQMYDFVLGYNQPAQTTEPQQVHMDPDRRPGFTPTTLDTGSDPNNFINLYGGNKDTMAHSGLAAVRRAEAAGMSLEEIQRMAATQGISFGQKAQDYFAANKAPSAEDMFASQISSMQEMFQASMQQQMMQFQQMQQAQDERMMALQQQMQQSMAAQQQRPEVAGVKMAEGTGGTPMQIARRGVAGAFGRRGMRISSLNV